MRPNVQAPLEPYTALGDGIHQIRLPMNDHVLRYINAYLIEDDGGYTLVDCGWGLPDVLAALKRSLADIGVPVDRVRTVVATHFHMDHYGLAGTLARIAGAQVMMHHADWLILDERYRDVHAETERRDAWLRRHGLNESGFSGEERIRYVTERFTLVAPDRELADGELLQIGAHRFRVVWTPGHTPGHICLYDEERRTLMSGDHILPGITPHIGFWEGQDEDPLGSYLASLVKVAALGARSGLPAHREPIADLPGRIEEILEHHADREAQVLAALGDRCTNGTYVASRLSWRKNRVTFEQLEPQQKTQALSETLAHLEHLCKRGLVDREVNPEAVRYKVAERESGPAEEEHE